MDDVSNLYQMLKEEYRKGLLRGAEIAESLEKNKWMQIQNTLKPDGKFIANNFLDVAEAIRKEAERGWYEKPKNKESFYQVSQGQPPGTILASSEELLAV